MDADYRIFKRKLYERMLNWKQTKDATFNTPSGAAVFCVGGSSNGWKDWRDEKNNELDIYRK